MIDDVSPTFGTLFGELDAESFGHTVRNEWPDALQVLVAPGLLDFGEGVGHSIAKLLLAELGIVLLNQRNGGSSVLLADGSGAALEDAGLIRRSPAVGAERDHDQNHDDPDERVVDKKLDQQE